MLVLVVVAVAALLGAAGVGPSSGDALPNRPVAHVATTHPLPAVAKARKRARPPKPKAPRVAAPAAALTPNDPLWQASWSLVKAGAPEAWQLTSGAPSVVVAVLDTGVDAGHADLAGAVVAGWDAVGEDGDPADDHGHGTAVAGVIGARADNGVGSVGVCWRCSVMPVKVIAADGTGTAGDIAEGIVWAADHGAAVLNLSFVMSGYDGAVAGAIDYAHAKGALVVAAAGNSGGGDATFPASHPGVIGVTATDGADARYEWASYGPWVAVAAPGCSQSTVLGGGYGEVCGTSSATAFASGVTALVRAADQQAGVEQVREAITSSAVRVGDFVATGRLDAAAAVRRTRPVPAAPPAPAPPSARASFLAE
jgi:thermitase